MSKIKEAIKEVQKNVSSAAINTYGAHIYDFEQVCEILEGLYDVVCEEEGGDDDDATTDTITRGDIDELIGAIEERIAYNVMAMNGTDILDEDSLEISLSGGSYTMDSLTVDRAYISSEAQDGIDDIVNEWCYENKIILDGPAIW
jgi:hypothetical protein